MPDTKISALPAATTPLAGTELVPIVQSGITSRVSVDNLTAGKTVAAATVNVDANTASAAVRITQTGAGNALVVEDSANPDATPFAVDSDGRVLIGHTASIPAVITGQLQVTGTTNNNGSTQQLVYSASAASPRLTFGRSNSNTIGTNAIVNVNEVMGEIRFVGADGTSFVRGAAIAGAVDAAPGTNSMPGRLIFSTTANGASVPTERMRIDSTGDVGIGTISPTARLNVVDATSQDAVRITQTGTGNALVVEDSANPDSTPLVVDASGTLIVGNTQANVSSYDIQSVTTDGASFVTQRFSANNGGSFIRLDKSRGTNPNVTSGADIVAANDVLGTLEFRGFDGNAFTIATQIYVEVDGTPGTNDMPGRLVFSTTADGASTSTERARIDSRGFTTLTGSFGRGAPVTKTGNFTLADTENWIICNGTGTITVTFPAASSWTGREVVIKTIAAQTVVSASSNVLPINSATAGTAILAATSGAWATLVSNGSNWVIMQRG